MQYYKGYRKTQMTYYVNALIYFQTELKITKYQNVHFKNDVSLKLF